jgi:hypothetical protein
MRAWSDRVAQFCASQGLATTSALVRLIKTKAYKDAKYQFTQDASHEVVHAMLCEAMEQAGLNHGKTKGPG